MTATLAAELHTRVAHMVKVRAEYEHTKADHALTDGCDDCSTGFVEGRDRGWDYAPDGTPTRCPNCAYADRRAIDVGDRTTCANNHPWIPKNLFERHSEGGGGGVRLSCRLCRRERWNSSYARRRARKAVSR